MGSGGLVRVHQMLDDRDPVFQEQLAFLETPEKQVVSSRGRYGDLGDDGIEIPVLGGQDSKPRGEAAIVGAGRGAVIHVGSHSERERLQAGLTAIILGLEGAKYNAMTHPTAPEALPGVCHPAARSGRPEIAIARNNKKKAIKGLQGKKVSL